MIKNLSPTRKRRMVLHIVSGIIILLLANFFYEKSRWMLFAILISGILLTLLSLRFKLPFFYFMLKKFETPKYLGKFPGKGALFFVAGCLLALRLFGKEQALASIAILTFADPASHFIGVKIGKTSHKKPFNKFKKVEGTLFGIIVAFVSASFFVSYIEAFFAAAISMIAEALIIKLGGDNVDDNLIIPMASGTTMNLIARFFH